MVALEFQNSTVGVVKSLFQISVLQNYNRHCQNHIIYLDPRYNKRCWQIALALFEGIIVYECQGTETRSIYEASQQNSENLRYMSDIMEEPLITGRGGGKKRKRQTQNKIPDTILQELEQLKGLPVRRGQTDIAMMELFKNFP